MKTEPFSLHETLMDPIILSHQGIWNTLVPRSIPDHHLENLITANSASVLGLRSLDHTRRTYVSEDLVSRTKERQNEEKQQAVEFLTEAFQRVKATSLRLDYREYKTERIGQFASMGALTRLLATFYWSTIMCGNGYHIETSTMNRQAIEQLAWVAKIYNLNDNSYWRIQPQSCLKSLVEIFPYAGRLYGSLSSSSHLHPEETKRYLTLNTEHSTVHFATEIDYEGLMTVAQLVDMYECMYEINFHDLGLKVRNIVVDADGTPTLVESRDSKQWADSVGQWVKDVCTS